MPTLQLNYDGAERTYFHLQPGATRRQHTYLTHPWTFRATTSAGNPAVVVCEGRAVLHAGRGAETVASLRLPARLAWSLETHRRFPEGFKDFTRELLRVHRALRTRPAPAYWTRKAVSRGPDLSDLPPELVLHMVSLLAGDVTVLDVKPPLRGRDIPGFELAPPPAGPPPGQVTTVTDSDDDDPSGPSADEVPLPADSDLSGSSADELMGLSDDDSGVSASDVEG